MVQEFSLNRIAHYIFKHSNKDYKNTNYQSMSTRVKLVMLGGKAAGKSALILKLETGRFFEYLDSSIEEPHRTTINIDGEALVVDVLDPAGQEEYSALRDQYIRSGDGYIIVYSITSTTSFLEANGFRDQLYRVLEKDKSEHIPIALVGNKCDLESERQVPTDEAKKLAKEWNVMFFETSAKDNINITETFETLIKDVIAHKPQNTVQTKTKKCVVV